MALQIRGVSKTYANGVRALQDVTLTIIDKGQILLEAEPLRAVEDLQGRIWRRVISKDALPALKSEYAVISTKLLAGRTVVHVYGDVRPGSDFEPVEPDLEDVYFCSMTRRLGAA